MQLYGILICNVYMHILRMAIGNNVTHLHLHLHGLADKLNTQELIAHVHCIGTWQSGGNQLQKEQTQHVDSNIKSPQIASKYIISRISTLTTWRLSWSSVPALLD